ncbi:hypothetical protein LTR37_005216 [Vermiconidia calcicola]|uniref:Uncharacterized protein n=1 Tax=Vermiconidia calcicola TaxID=1690605 RepID=A0ACC3NKF1_9PEZI|nr:hypothetical protein LTR37_005216 [Vermiconidia calcicola]
MADSTDNNDAWSLYPYEPNKPAPMVFAVLLTVLGSYQIYQSFVRYHWKKYGFTFTWATTVWISGFVCRSISVYNVQAVNIFIAQFVLVLMGPPLYAAAEYFILGRLLAYLPYHTPIHPGRVFSTFIMLSIIVETLTANGAANSAGSSDRDPGQVESGLACLKAALILQCLIEALFFSLVAYMEYKCRKARNFPRKVRVVCYTLYITSFMLLVRCIVRTIEGFEAASCATGEGPPGYCGSVSMHEYFLYIFEIANITLFVAILVIFHPGKYLPRDTKIFLDPIDGMTERMGPGFSKADKRPLFVTVIDPFNIGGIVSGKGMVLDKFWEQQQPAYEGGEISKDDGKMVEMSE